MTMLLVVVRSRVAATGHRTTVAFFFFFAESEVIGVAGGEAGVAGAGIVGASDAGPEFLVAEVVGPGVILLESRSSFQPQRLEGYNASRK